ncbi:hypothetical protein TVAG_172180 [Trichomonas vaginalis G3]|uniref:Uncharacterized protein n=1 Tax=Trichomonas vaginalis (strain ATCC PRA-98 / G3) TaxID=412133 RepID=A2DEW9_TRIV3|nr:hypothetical protein TVAGG3_0530720 [Trichomonas vaginalis G3]EAY20961.1 hypothetical protein TVAG_172180 [Trichomonas vaginalis G3]KAI5519121.1 hypothetical protein TVAGG3_0530720 [Trichomonas vaginalis G3]|eukprot:XP_001581947.1 hypothetical protein [Trichomonas vaginalis G3]
MEELDYTAVHWENCASVKGMEKKYQDSVILTISTARSGYFLRLVTLYSFPLNMKENTPHPYEIAHKETDVLWHTYPVQIIQIITSCIGNMMGDPDKYIPCIISYFTNDPYSSQLFGYLTFPSLCFYFMTPEFVEIGANIIFSTLKYTDGPLVMHMCASLYDSISNFNNILWDHFNYSITPEKSVIAVFTDSIKEGFSVLTQKHQEFTKNLISNFPLFAIKFFTFYFSSQSKAYNTFKHNNKTQSPMEELMEILNFAASNPESAIAKVILSSFHSDTFTSPFLSFSDMNLQTTSSILSPLETNTLFHAFLSGEMIKKGSKVASLKCKPEYANSLFPGSIIFSYKKFLSLNRSKFMPLVYEPEPEIVIEKNPDFKRDYEHIILLASNNGLKPLEVINNPLTPAVLDTLNHVKSMKTEGFIDYVYKKQKKIINKAQSNFESFFEWLSTDIGLKRCQMIFSLDLNRMEIILSQMDVSKKFPDPSKIPLHTIAQKDIAFINTLKSVYDTNLNSPYVYLCALNLSNIYPKDELIPEMNDSYISKFIQSERLRIMLEKNTSNQHYYEIAHKISEDANLPIGERILKITDAFIQLNNLMGADKSTKFASIAVDILIMSGREDFFTDIMYLENIASKFYAAAENHNPQARFLWTVTFSELVKRLSQANSSFQSGENVYKFLIKKL